MAGIGIIGGSGFYELLEDAQPHDLDTPFGAPSDTLSTGTFAGREVAFVPRHGRGHVLPPHRINYRANIWALRELGVQRLFAPCAVGGLKVEHAPGTFVVLDQFVDRTTGRSDTFYDEAPVTHVSMADPYCPELRSTVNGALDELGLPHAPDGTIVVIDGPRFATRAESRSYSAAGWDVIGMTQCPEVPLAREQALCVTGVAMVTDHDAGLEGHPEVEPVTAQTVVEVFERNLEHLKQVLRHAVERVPAERGCDCGRALEGARMG